MNQIEKRISGLARFGDAIALKLEGYKNGDEEELKKIIVKAKEENPWYTERSILTALDNWVKDLEEEYVRRWVTPYIENLVSVSESINVGVINAGNIPFVGLHDLISVMLCGHNYIGKNASGDTILLPYLSGLLCESETSFTGKINFVPRLEKMDAIIATGNNNSARYFEYYFGKYPHIIRKNRNGVAVLNGNETNEQFHELGRDIFEYFGLGCRNVSKMYVPMGYNFNKFFESIYDYNEVMSHSKYMNNFDYNNSVMLLKQIPFLQNGFLILRNEKQIASPISVVHYEEFDNFIELEKNLKANIESLQCIVSAKGVFSDKDLEKIQVDFGKTQSPALWDYADGVDTVRFLCNL